MNELVIKQNEVVQLTEEAISKINVLEQQKAMIKKAEEDLKSNMIEQMEKYGVTQIKNDLFTISYTPEHTQSRFDSKAFKEQSPVLYDSYCKESTVKASIKITLKKEKK